MVQKESRCWIKRAWGVKFKGSYSQFYGIGSREGSREGVQGRDPTALPEG